MSSVRGLEGKNVFNEVQMPALRENLVSEDGKPSKMSSVFLPPLEEREGKQMPGAKVKIISDAVYRVLPRQFQITAEFLEKEGLVQIDRKVPVNEDEK